MLNFKYEPLTGEEAVAEMRSVLAGNEGCLSLLDRVADFFGGHIDLGEATRDVSGFWPNTDNQPPIVLEIALAESQRKLEALTHELLHADIMISGYPFLRKISYNLDRFHGEAPNYVYHEVMAPRFAHIGLEPKNFQLPPEWQADEGLTNSNWTFTCWCKEWICFWLHARHTGDQHSEAQAQQILYILKPTQFAGVEWAAVKLKELFNSRAFLDADTFEDAYDELTTIMRAPKAPRENWFRIESGPDGAFIRR